MRLQLPRWQSLATRAKSMRTWILTARKAMKATLNAQDSRVSELSLTLVSSRGLATTLADFSEQFLA